MARKTPGKDHPERSFRRQKIQGNLDIGHVKPSRENAALRYLWARHRIMLLSDYNRLRISDSRIREATDLGLTHNLLTAYTSFVAVDTEVRNSDGRSMRVQQPLPCPRGFQLRLGRHDRPSGRSPVPYATERDGNALGGQASDGCPAPEGRGERQDVKPLTVENISMSSGLSKDTIDRVVHDQLRGLESCLGIDRRGKIVLQFTVRPDGAVKEVQILSGPFRSEKNRGCLIAYVKT